MVPTFLRLRVGLPTHSVVLYQKLEVFDGRTLAALEDGGEVLGVRDEVFGGCERDALARLTLFGSSFERMYNTDLPYPSVAVV